MPIEARTDEALVSAAQAGDRDALEALLERHYDRLHAVCVRLTGNPADGADAAQEALIAIARGLGRFDGRSRFSTWAYRVAVNAALDEMRRRRRRPQPVPDPTAGSLGLEAGSTAGSGNPGQPSGSPTGVISPGPAMDTAIADRVDIDRALQRIPPEFRAAVVLRDLCGLDYAEIAEVLDIPAGTVRSRIARGRAALEPLLRPGNSPSPDHRHTYEP